MENIAFKELFNKVAKNNNFEKAFGGWFKSSAECIVVLDLQKSNYDNYFELNIKIFIQGVFGNTYVKSKELVKKFTGNIFTRQPNNFKDALDLTSEIDDMRRKERLESLFDDFIVPVTNKALTRIGVRELADQKILILLPAVKEELLFYGAN